MNLHKNVSGFSLIEAITAIGVLSLLSLGTITIFNSINSFQKNLVLTEDLQSLLGLSRIILSDPKNCSFNIPHFQNSGKDNLPRFDASQLGSEILDVTELKTSTGHSIIQNGQPLGRFHDTKITLSLTKFVEITPDSHYAGELRFYMRKNTGGVVSAMGPSIIRSLPLNLKTTASGTVQTIIECSMQEQGGSANLENFKSEMCLSLSGTYDNQTGLCDIGPYYQQ